MTALVNADLFRIVAGFVSKEETRYYLQGVLIQKHQTKGVYLVATDGHRCMIVHDENGQTTLEDVIVRLDKAALTACKPAKSDRGDRLLEVNGDGFAQVLEPYGDEMRPTAICHGAIIDGTFPDWRRIANPLVETLSTATFNYAYVSDFGAAAKELSKLKNAGLRIIANGENPALVRFLGVDHAYGVLMPLRDNCDDKVPFFMTSPSAEELAAARARQEAAE